MFKPHYGQCTCCGEPGLIVIKKGLRDTCNFKHKQAKKHNGDRTTVSGCDDEDGVSNPEGQDIEGYTNVFRTPIRKKKKVQHSGKRTSPDTIREKVSFGKASGLQGITKEHTLVYMSTLGYTIADFVPCELTGKRCVDVHHIFARGMGGSDLENELYNRIENLMGLSREAHDLYGDKEQHYDMLIDNHFRFLSDNGIKYDKNFFDKWPK